MEGIVVAGQDGAVAQLREFRHIDRAQVLKGDELAGWLIRTPAGFVIFEYDAAWIAEGRPAIASTLPVGSEPILCTDNTVPAHFACLVPEGARRDVLESYLGKGEFTMLVATGWDLVGDVRVLPVEGSALDPQPLLLDDPHAVHFAEYVTDDAIISRRVGLAGTHLKDHAALAQLTLPAMYHDDPYIVKFAPAEMPELVANEAFFMQASREVGVQTADFELTEDGDGVMALLVKRFDRAQTPEGIVRLAVEDGSQVLNTRHKFGMEAADVFNALIAQCSDRADAAANFFRQYVADYVFGNSDAHAQNFAVVRGLDSVVAPAPAFDKTSTANDGLEKFSLTIAGHSYSHTGMKQDLLTLGQQIGLSADQARAIVEDVVVRSKPIVDAIGTWQPDRNPIGLTTDGLARLQRVTSERHGILAKADVRASGAAASLARRNAARAARDPSALNRNVSSATHPVAR